MSTYQRTVAAAVAETKSKFALAEALATDIPPRRPGPGPELTVTEHLILARGDIIAAGGEARSVQTLSYYRDTALWVSTGTRGNYRWISGISFTAHDAARSSGLSYEEFAANPKRAQPAAERTYERAAKLLRNLTSEQKAQAVGELLDEPQARAAAGRVLDEHYDRDRALRQRETPVAAPSEYDHTVEVLVRLRAISAAIKNATDAVQGGPPLGNTTDDLVAVVDWQLNALTILRAVLAGRSDMDAELASILEEG